MIMLPVRVLALFVLVSRPASRKVWPFHDWEVSLKPEHDEVLKKRRQKETKKKTLSQSNIQGSFKSRGGQLTLEQSLQQKHRQYTKGSPRHMEVTKGWQPL